MAIKCKLCEMCFSRRDYLNRHYREIHQGISITKYNCSHINVHKDCTEELPKVTFNDITRIISKHALTNTSRTIRFYSKLIFQPHDFLKAVHPFIKETLGILQMEKMPMKINTILCVSFTSNKTNKKDDTYFSIAAVSIEHYDLDQYFELLLEKIEIYNKRGSDWKLTDTHFLELCVTNHGITK
jgi:hypothetical protein